MLAKLVLGWRMKKPKKQSELRHKIPWRSRHRQRLKSFLSKSLIKKRDLKHYQAEQLSIKAWSKSLEEDLMITSYISRPALNCETQTKRRWVNQIKFISPSRRKTSVKQTSFKLMLRRPSMWKLSSFRAQSIFWINLIL